MTAGPAPAVDLAAPLVYLITDRHATGGRALTDVVATALRAVARAHLPPDAVAVQLREKDLGTRALLELARALRVVTRDTGTSLFINDRVDIARAVDADGVHLARTSLAPADVAALDTHATLRIAVSTHTRAEVDVAARSRDRNVAPIAFAVFGPVFDTPSKRSYGAARGLDELRDACATNLPVLALGGVDVNTARACVRAGARGVACIRAVMSAADPEAALARIFEAIEST